MKLLDNAAVLIHNVNQDIAFRMRTDLAPHEITPDQALILILLSEREELSQNEIAHTLNKDKSSITRMVLSLENRGLIHRLVGDEDRRLLRVSLTKEGRLLGETVIPIMNEMISRLYIGISDAEMQELHRLLAKVSDNAKQI